MNNSGSIVSFPAGTKDVFLTLPAEVAVVSSNNPSTAGYVLSSNGTGVAPSWVAGTSITVGAAGSNTQVQYNNSGVLGASSNFTFDGTNIGLAGGTANGVAYLNGSKVLTTGSALTYNGSFFKVIGADGGTTAFLSGASGQIQAFGYADATRGSLIEGLNAAGNAYIPLTFNGNPLMYYVNGSEQMRLTSTGLGIGTSSPAYKLVVAGTSPRIVSQDTTNNYIAVLRCGNTVGYVGTESNIPFQVVTNGNGVATFDTSGNLGLGVTPSAWGYGGNINVPGGGRYVSSTGDDIRFGSNVYNDISSVERYAASGYAERYRMANGGHYWSTAPSGTAGNAITFTQAMTLDASGNLLLGTTTSTGLTTNQFQLGTTSNANSGIQVLSSTTGTGGIYFGDSTSGAGRYSGYLEYNHSTNAMLFTTDATERMRIDSSGNVGIGTSSPSAKLHVAGNALVAQPSSANSYVSVSGSSGSYSGVVSLQRGGTEDGSVYCASANYNPASASIADLVFSNGGGGRNFRWANNTTLAMTLDASGNLGLGVTPSAWASAWKAFQGVGGSVVNRNGAIEILANAYYDGAFKYVSTGYGANRYNVSDGGYYWLTAPSGTAGNPITFTQAMTLDASGNLGVGSTSPSVPFEVKKDGVNVTGNWYNIAKITDGSSNKGFQFGYDSTTQTDILAASTSSAASNMAFWTYSGSAWGERMRIDSSGNVGIGTSSPAAKLEVSGSSCIRWATTDASWINAYATNPARNAYIGLATDADSHVWKTGGSERMRIDSSGNVGIGTSSPSYKVDVYGTSNAGRVRVTDTITATFDLNSTYATGRNFLVQSISDGAYRIYDATAAAERMRIDSSGNVGIGTSSINSTLTIYKSASQTDVDSDTQCLQVINGASDTSGNLSGISYKQSNGTNVARAFLGLSSTGTSVTRANFVFACPNTSGNATERMRIDSSGNLLVGTTTVTGGGGITLVPSASAPYVFCSGSESTNSGIGYYLYSTGAAAYRFYVGYGGTVYATNTTISAISDQRYKENVRDLNVGLNAVLALKPRVFDWKAGKGKDIKNDRGFIAQEFEQVFPDLIDEWKDPAPEGEEPYKSVRQDLIPVLVKAIQELKAELDATKAEVAALRAK